MQIPAAIFYVRTQSNTPHHPATAALTLKRFGENGLIKKVSAIDGTLVNYSYLADGTKISALDDQGDGLEYRGSLTFRRNGSSLQIEGIDFPGGRFVAKENGTGGITLVPHYHITDHLGSVRAVVDGSTGQVVETNDYYPFGKRWDSSSSVTSPDNRFRFNGKEDQAEFGSSLSDYGARQYSASTGRWLAMDPLAEKYYPVSPYAFCNNNPVNLVDPDGRFPDAIWDVTSIGIGIHNLIDNIQSGNIRGAIGDGVGIAVDAIAAAVPLIPGGVGAIRAGAKIANTVDNAADAARTAEAISDGKVYATYTKVNPKTGEVYSGRASGYGTPTEVVAKRDRSHHMNEKGFEKAELDKYSTNYDAIRGREQYLIELNGGTKSQGGSSGNAINGVSPTNPNRQRYEDARRKEFGK